MYQIENKIVGTFTYSFSVYDIDYFYQIYKNGNQYQGKIVWLSEPIDPVTKKPKTDTKHPNPEQHNRPLLGLINLWGFQFNEKEGNWAGGHIYDPKNGKEYKCNISFSLK